MKISKLFHWLYAVLMLLPVFAIGSKVLYVSINQNANSSYSAEPFNYDENVINNSNDIELNQWYHIDTSYFDASANIGWFYYSNIRNIYNTTPSNVALFESCNRFYLYSNSYIQIADDNSNSYWISLTTNTIQFDVIILSKPTFNNVNSGFVEMSVVSFGNLDNALYYSVYQVSQEGLFSWANESFLAEPITYITGLFGMPNNSPVITMLSYWLAISIIWLVFDLIMYIPLLVHRWIDKGVLE